jgi:hypothetical protein
VQIYLRHAREVDGKPGTLPPSFEDFRSTIEMLDRRSKSFAQKASDVIAELRRFGQSVERLNRSRFLTQLVLIALGIVVGVLIGNLL